MEMIFVLLFLGLTCGICVRLFAASYTSRQRAREADHIQELVTDTGEILEGTDGSVQSFLALMPDGTSNDGTTSGVKSNELCYYFDKQWQSVSQENSVYKMTVTLSVSDSSKSAEIQFSKIAGQTEEESLYTQTIRFPLSEKAKGADS